MTATRKIAAVSFAAMALLLAGCASGGNAEGTAAKSEKQTEKQAEAPAAEQTKQEACTDVQTALQELSGLSSVDASDPAAALAALKDASGTVSETAAKVGNPEVKAAADQAAVALDEYVVYLDSMVADPANADIAAMGDHITALQESVTELGTVCAS
ncbi:hypothetical protein [Agromyces mediolanus]|uniref:hypothetical protein n=1 Tax=Agromyces mediolanus TaxID=41986 RepID=UPI001E389086|nr:hypothetical protein [Agromyces mediolanus]MCD1570902.1 hypothetical protein [Agromyces mediolanus]